MKKFKMPWSRSEKKHRNPIEKETEFGFEVESLESRKMLAGTVNVTVSASNNVNITGDSADNDIGVTVVAGDIVVFGVAGFTTVNGGTTNLAAADLNKLTIKMKGGRDVAQVFNVNPQGRFRMTGGAGRDILIFTGGAVNKLQIIGGTGNDSMVISAGATVAEKLTMNGGSGNDSARLENATFTSDVKANMGHGADTIKIMGGVSLGPKTTLVFGGGDDVLDITTFPTIPAGRTVLINGGGGTDLSNPAPAVLDAIVGVTVESFEGLFV